MYQLNTLHHLPAKHRVAQRLVCWVSVLGQRRQGTTHDLVRAPAIQRLRRRIPGHDVADPIERVDRERRALKDTPETLVGMAQGRLPAPVLSLDGAQRQAGDGKNPDVQEEHHGRTRYARHDERTAAARGVADGDNRHRERRERRAARARS